VICAKMGAWWQPRSESFETTRSSCASSPSEVDVATCAACLGTIAGRDQFILAGTEVFHRACARSIADSIGTQRQLEIIRLRQDLSATHQEAARLRAELADSRNAIDRALDNQARVAGDKEKSVRGQRDAATRRAERAQVLIDGAEDEMRRAQKERDAMRLERDAAFAELALLRALGPGQSATETSPDVGPPGDDLDDAEQRFRLLELDGLK